MEMAMPHSLVGHCVLSSAEQRQTPIYQRRAMQVMTTESTPLIYNLRVLVFLTFVIISPEDKSYKYIHT